MKAATYLKNITTLRYDSTKCIGCGLCVDVCPHRVFQMDGRKAYITDKDRCMECGACELNCISSAINVSKGVGCAAAVINSYFNKGEVSCGPECCK